MVIYREKFDKYISGELVDPLNPNSADIRPTAELHKGNHNGYSPERNELHDEIIRRHIVDRKPGVEKRFVVISGGMAVGMTTLGQLLEAQNIINEEDFVYIRPGSFALLPEFAIRDHYQHPEKSPLLIDECQHIQQRITEKAASLGLSIVLYEMGDRSSEMIQVAKTAASHGYGTALLGITIKEEDYFFSARAWEVQNGRLSDHVRALGIMKKFCINWESYLPAFDASFLIEKDFKDDRDHVKLIAKSLKCGSSTQATQILDEASYQKFCLRRFINVEGKNAQEAMRYSFIENSDRFMPENTNSHEGESCNRGELEGQPAQLLTSLNNLFDHEFDQKYTEVSQRRSANRKNRRSPFANPQCRPQ